MGGYGLFGEGVEAGAVLGAGVEHVAAGELVHHELFGQGGGELILREDRAHEGAAEVVPAVKDDDLEFGVGGDGFAEVGDGPAAEVLVAGPVPHAVYVVTEGVVAGVGLPANDAGDEVDGGSSGGGDDGLENRVVGLTGVGVGEGIGAGDVRVVDGADLTLFAMHFAKVRPDLKAAAFIADKGRVEA